MEKRKRVIFDIETTHLSPWVGRISCVSMMNPETKEIESCTDSNETRLLEWVMQVFTLCDEIIGFNVNDFDIDFIFKRCLVKGVKVVQPKVLDLRLVLGRGNKFSRGTMRMISQQLGFEAETVSGAQMAEMYKKNDMDSIKRHCEEDVLMNYALWKRLKEIELI